MKRSDAIAIIEREQSKGRFESELDTAIGVACCRTGRRYIGIENEKQYYDVMRTRLRECCRPNREVG